MKSAFSRLFGRCAALALLSFCGLVQAQVQRVPNTTLTLPPAPPTHGYTSVNAFSGLIFTNPICIVSPPEETNRLFILSKNGVITVITNLAAPNETTFMDLTPQVSSQSANSGTAGERGLLGMAFHPGFATNGYFFLLYMPTNSAQGGYFDRLARFQVSPADPNHCNTNTQVVFYDQTDPDPNHNAGDIHFGADGYLYISVGDEGKEHDGFNCAQVITNSLFSGLLRIDVDKRPGNFLPNPAPSNLTISSNYRIPADNPFIGINSFDGMTVNPSMVRTEFYAVGLRNPWRWNFDFHTNAYGTNVLYCGDVGQDKYEEVDVIEKGGNYGWAYWEGTNVASGGSLPHDTYIPASGTNIHFPIVHYAHGSASDQGNCVIGGVVYRGSNLPQLYGYYVYADYVDGNIWALLASDYT
ncbi:MAG TPA: PQQ-dependent sugar dehydrogenase, partial [Candidatus Binatia bacterium]|nr:PQQ-dependent sugar dehydrogenase [Candidatus Binatia bacterium]